MTGTLPLGEVAQPRRRALLARVADAVYWAGRYLERAEGLARIVQVHGETHMDLPVGADVGWLPLLAVTGAEAGFADRHSLLLSGRRPGDGRPREDEVVAYVCCDMDNSSSILAALSATRSNIRIARAVLPRDAWTVVNAVWRRAHEHRDDVGARERRAVWLQEVLDGCGRLNGLLWASMPRDDVMAFFRAGQHVERADLTVRLLAVRADDVVAGPADAPYAEVHRSAVLRALAADQPFRRSAIRDPGRGAVARFLLRDEQFPRSVSACLAEVRRLAKDWPRHDAVVAACTDASVLVAGVNEEAERVPGLERAVEAVRLAVEEVHRQMAATYFDRLPDPGAGSSTVPGPPAGRRVDRAEERPDRVSAQRLPLPVGGGFGTSARGGRATAPRPAGTHPPASGLLPGGRRYRIVHRTVYRYSAPATQSYNEAHLRPRATDRQRCLASHLSVRPAPAVQSSYIDLFGNPVTTFVVEGEFDELEVVAESDVAVGPVSPPRRTPPWETARRLLDVDRQPASRDARRFRAGSRLVPSAPALAEYAAPSFTPNRPLFDAVTDLAARIHHDLVYDPGFTSVTTPVLDVLDHRRGVCQDFAHLAIGCVRAMGLAARYVSGYIETIPAPGQDRVVGADASHAWFAVFLPGWGWLELDPTNDQLVSLAHVTTAWGRDYADVSPLRGTVEGGGSSHELTVSVSVDRIESPPGG